ncbi:putative ribosome maturation factor RimP [Rosa chinensis]|uniref:Putative ribosome maturation factor RimP n=1 Tax=Rosa chinensis TaxID=74649 RepID=A0A2P6R2M9_ROSCH|nr:uncharacterized protein LOC112199702 [Rosa chinensis]PRQ40619.1 putative ribosome maturation factor RimP [Rosa chinensis]
MLLASSLVAETRMMNLLLQLHLQTARRCITSSSSSFRRNSFLSTHPIQQPLKPSQHLNPPHSSLIGFSPKPRPTIFSPATLRFLTTQSSEDLDDYQDDTFQGEETEEGGTSDGWEEGDSTDGWEDEDVAEPKVGDGGDGGGVVFHGVPWGEQALSIAREVLTRFCDDMKLFSFKTTPRGYVFVRLDKLSNEYGCPSMEDLGRYSKEYKKRLDEVGALGEIPEDLAVEVSSPGAERLLKVPGDLPRFKDKTMRVCYLEDVDSKHPEKDGVFMLESVETESESCVWKLANVKENRDPDSKGRPLTRKQTDWRLKLPFSAHKRVLLYLNSS